MPGLSSMGTTSPYQQQDPYRRAQTNLPVDLNPFGFLREAHLPFEVIQQISMTDQPVPLAAFMRHETDMKVPMMADYNRAYTQYRHQLPPDDVRTFASNEPFRDYRPDMQMANTYQVIQIANMREKYKAAIRGNDKTLGRVTNPTVDDLSITQLIEYLSRQQLEIASTMNSWFYSMGIILAGGMCSNIFNGGTGVRVLDRFVNLSSLSTRLREMKEEPWWDYSLRQISKNGVENHPGLGFAMIIAMALSNSVQDGVLKYNKERDLKVKEEREARALRIENSRRQRQSSILDGDGDTVYQQFNDAEREQPMEDADEPHRQGTQSQPDDEGEGEGEEDEIPTRPMIARRATEDTAMRSRARSGKQPASTPVGVRPERDGVSTGQRAGAGAGAGARYPSVTEEKGRSQPPVAGNSDRIKELLRHTPL
jgi:hypothetical protein